jgi:hypothetical protein
LIAQGADAMTKVLEHKLRSVESTVFAEIDDEAVLLNVETGVYFGLDSVGTRIWTLLGLEMDQEEICRELLEEYEVDPEQLRGDVAEFLDVLVAKGLARIAEA